MDADGTYQPTRLFEPELRTSAYRQARPLPTQISDHVTISFEEQLHSQALSLLTQCLTAGTGGPRAACVPSSDILALIATLSVHPSMTTRTTSADKHVAADQALRYLQLLNSLVGPQISDLRTAFRFSDLSQSRTGRVKQRSLVRDHDGENGINALNTVYVTREALWSNAGDIWAVVGWAFNCSILHKHRWERWNLFLSMLVDVLQADLKDAIRSQAGTSQERSVIERTLLYHYLLGSTDGNQQKRRVMRAILANGDDRSIAEFGEIWTNETALPKVNSEQPRRQQKLDLDNNQYGDYDNDSDDGVTVSQEIRVLDQEEPRASATATEDLAALDPLGDSTCLSLRQRFLSLLLHFSSTAPQAFIEVEELRDLYMESFRGMSFRSFQQLLFPPSPFLNHDTKSALDQVLLRPLLDSKAPLYTMDTLTQEDFEELFAPFAAQLSSVSDNAKVSIIVEDLMRMLWKTKALVYSEKLQEAVALGITRRSEKARSDGRKRTATASQEERDCMQELRSSGERMLCILDMIQRNDT